MKENILQVKSLSFAIDSVNLYKTPNEKKEFILSKQLLRSGTSIGANIREANNAQSKADFIHNCTFPKKNVMKQFIGWNY